MEIFISSPMYYTSELLKDIVGQLDPRRRNVVEFRHKSWWNDEVYKSFRQAMWSFDLVARHACPMSL
jgi:uncharacterized protein YecE (DUF72 family)